MKRSSLLIRSMDVFWYFKAIIIAGNIAIFHTTSIKVKVIKLDYLFPDEVQMKVY